MECHIWNERNSADDPRVAHPSGFEGWGILFSEESQTKSIRTHPPAPPSRAKDPTPPKTRDGPPAFLNPKLGPVSIIRPTAEPNGGATAAVKSFVDDGLFIDPATNRNTGIVAVLFRLAEEADEARRGRED